MNKSDEGHVFSLFQLIGLLPADFATVNPQAFRLSLRLGPIALWNPGLLGWAGMTPLAFLDLQLADGRLWKCSASIRECWHREERK